MDNRFQQILQEQKRSRFGQILDEYEPTLGETVQAGAAGLAHGFVEGLVSGPMEGLGILTGSEGIRQTGEDIGEWAGGMYPENPLARETLTAKAGEAVGQGLGFMVPGGVAGKGLQAVGAGAKAIKVAQTGMIMTQGALANGAGGYYDALASGADEETAFKSFLLNAGVGTSEALPLARILNRANADGMVRKWIAQGAKDALIEGAEEAVQETSQQFLGNLIAQNLYDEDRELLEGAIEGGGLGAFAGVVLSALGTGARRLRSGPRASTSDPSGPDSSEKDQTVGAHPAEVAPSPEAMGASVLLQESTGSEAADIIPPRPGAQQRVVERFGERGVEAHPVTFTGGEPVPAILVDGVLLFDANQSDEQLERQIAPHELSHVLAGLAPEKHAEMMADLDWIDPEGMEAMRRLVEQTYPDVQPGTPKFDEELVGNYIQEFGYSLFAGERLKKAAQRPGLITRIVDAVIEALNRLGTNIPTSTMRALKEFQAAEGVTELERTTDAAKLPDIVQVIEEGLGHMARANLRVAARPGPVQGPGQLAPPATDTDTSAIDEGFAAAESADPKYIERKKQAAEEEEEQEQPAAPKPTRQPLTPAQEKRARHKRNKAAKQAREMRGAEGALSNVAIQEKERTSGKKPPADSPYVDRTVPVTRRKEPTAAETAADDWDEGRFARRASKTLPVQDGIEDRLRTKLNRKADVGLPRNPRTPIKLKDGRTFVVGWTAPREWLKRVQGALTSEEFERARHWYRDARAYFEEIGEDWNQWAMAWLVGNKNVDVSGAMLNAIRGREHAISGGKGPKAGLSEDDLQSFWKYVEGLDDTLKVRLGRKLHDFLDSETGRTTRRWMGDDARAGEPFVVDVHTFRDMGYVDEPLFNFLIENAVDPDAVRALALDQKKGAPNETQYERAAEKGQRLVSYLNKMDVNGGAWTAAEVQAVGWIAMQKTLGRDLGFPSETVPKHVKTVPVAALFGEGAPYNKVFPELAEMTFEQQTAVTSKVVDAALEVLAPLIGDPRVLSKSEGGGGRMDYPPEPAVVLRVLVTPETSRDLASGLAYLLQQTEVRVERPSNPSDSAVAKAPEWFVDIKGKEVTTEEGRQALRAVLNGKSEALSGYHVIDGGIRLGVSKKGRSVPKELKTLAGIEALADTVIREAVEETGFKLVGDVLAGEVHSAVNDWNRQKTGRVHLEGIGARYGSAVARDLRDRGRKVIREAYRQAIDEAKGGSPSYARRTSTPAFKRWFGDSKVVDADGKPLVVYHGTPDARGFAGEEPAAFRGLGEGEFWFSDSPKTANSYADDTRAFDYQGADPAILPVHLSLQNPKVIDAHELAKDPGKPWLRPMAALIENAREAGHDSVIIKHLRDDYPTGGSNPSTHYVAFRPEQIKSATGNRGTFDADDPDIRHARRTSENRVQPKLTPRKFLKRFFTAGGLLPDDAFNRLIQRDGSVNAAMQRVANDVSDLERAAGKTPWEEINAGLQNPVKRNALPPKLREIVQNMRDHLDEMSQRMIASGAIEGDLVAKVEENMGVYLTRSYRVFDDPKWAEKVPVEVRNQAKAFIRKEMDLTDAQAENAIDVLLYEGKAAETPIALLAKSKAGSKDLSILKKRKDIPIELRRLFGEYTDPRVNYTRSMTKMAFLVSNHRFLTETFEAGHGTYFFREGEERPRGFHTKMAPEGSDVMNPLNGVYTSPEIADAFAREAASEQISNLQRSWLFVNGLVKYGKTVGSLMTQVRNFLGNIPFAVAQGHTDFKQIFNALKALSVSFNRMNTDEKRAYIGKLLELGVIHESARANELRSVLDDMFAGDSMTLDYGSLKTKAKALPDLLTKLYQAGDDFWKVYAYENERGRYGRAGMEGAALDQHAAQIVRNTYPTYSLVPEAIRKLRRVPLVGTFVAFPWEVMRTTAHTVRLIKTELASDNVKIRQIGAKRLVGSLVAASWAAGLTAASRALIGFTDDDDKAAREFLPPWSKHSDILWTKANADGTTDYVDLSYVDPYSYIKEPLHALLNGEGFEEKIIEAGASLLEPFLSEEIATRAAREVVTNQKTRGGPVYNEADAAVDQLKDGISHLWTQAFEPGTITSLRKIYYGATGKVTSYGKAFDPKIEALAMTIGMRISTLDVPQSLGFRTREYSDALGKGTSILSTVAGRRGEVSDDEIREAYEKMEASKQSEFRRMLRVVHAARAMGMSESELQDALRATLSKDKTKAVLTGRYEPYEPSSSFLRTRSLPPGDRAHRLALIKSLGR